MPLPLTQRDIEMYTQGRSTEELEGLGSRIHLAARAKEHLARLIASKDFQRKYAENDHNAVEIVNVLIKVQADGVSAVNSISEPDINTESSAWQAHHQAISAMQNDPDFVKRYMAGDADAVRQWNEVSVNGTAELLGVDPMASPVGQGSPAPAAASPQPGPADVGAVSTGGGS